MLRREQLLLQLESLKPGPVACIAGAGFGKSALLDQLDDRWLTIDDAHSWSGADLTTAVAQLQEHDGPAIVAGRFLPTELHGLCFATIDHRDLRFSPSETRDYLNQIGAPGNALRTATKQLSHGWPAGVAAVAQTLIGVDDPAALAQRLRALDRVIRRVVDESIELQPELARIVDVLAEVAVFDDELCQSLGSKASVESLQESGVTVERRGDGFRFVEPLRSNLRSNDLDDEKIRDLVSHLMARDLVHPAIDLCLGRGQRELAAQTIARLTRDQEALLIPTRLHAAMATIGAAARTHPRSLYVHAHVSAVHNDLAEGLRAIEQACDAFAAQDPDITSIDHLEALTTRGVWHVYGDELPRAKAVHDRCASALSESSPHRAQALVHDLRGVLHHGLSTEADLDIAIEELKLSYALWRKIGETAAATVTMFRLASALGSRGRRIEALSILDDVLNHGPVPAHDEMRLGLERAATLPYVGRADEVAELIDEVKNIGRALEDTWAVARCVVSDMVAASVRNDVDRVVTGARELEQDQLLHFGDAAEGGLWIDAMDALCRVGAIGEAKSAADAVRRISAMPEWMRTYSSASFEARCGDPQLAVEMLADLDLREDLETDKRWQLYLLWSYAGLRQGDAELAAKMFDAVYSEVPIQRAPDLPEWLEPQICDALRGGQAPRSTDLPISISVLDRFAVEQLDHDGVGVRLKVPSGRTSDLIKVLACGGGRLAVDQVIDRLWPEADSKLGRRRLRNVVRRVREACGAIIERESDMIGFSPDVQVDLWVARQNVAAAMTGSLDEAIAATAIADQPLLPDSRYEDWAEDFRSEHRTLLLRLLSRTAMLAEEAGRRSDAVIALERASAIDPMADRVRQEQLDRLRS